MGIQKHALTLVATATAECSEASPHSDQRPGGRSRPTALVRRVLLREFAIHAVARHWTKSFSRRILPEATTVRTTERRALLQEETCLHLDLCPCPSWTHGGRWVTVVPPLRINCPRCH